jgi:hypothetical protein
MIEIFKTNVRTKRDAKQVLETLNRLFSEVQANFDLQDRDRILRLQGIATSDLPVVKREMARLGFICDILI